MINNINRIGSFTSSQIYRLCGSPAPIKTYIDEKNLERKLNLSIETDAYSNAMAWGKFLEQRVHDMLGMEYVFYSDQTDLHPLYAFWAGSKDFAVEGVKISELKCYELKNFAYYTNDLLTKDTEVIKKNNPKEYWQSVSNAIIEGVSVAELITYCPFESELDEIKELAVDYAGADAWKYRFIYETPSFALPHLKDGGYYQNLNRFDFEIPKEDVAFLTDRVIEAGKKLIEHHVQTK